jgi:hypothetical protein
LLPATSTPPLPSTIPTGGTAGNSNREQGVYRYVRDESDDWELLYEIEDDEYVARCLHLPPNIPPDPDGTLYATVRDQAVPAPAGEGDGYLLRAVYPSDRGEFLETPTAVDYAKDDMIWFEEVEGGGDWSGLPAIGPYGIIVFNIDTQGEDTLMMYWDTLTAPVVLSSPDDGTDTGRQSSALVSWQEKDGADGYHIQWDVDPSFKVDPHNASPELASFRITGLESGKEYYWRVRVGAYDKDDAPPVSGNPVWSPMSEIWTFTTALGAPQWNPFIGGVPESPYNGATNVPIRPTFAWNAADWATGYEFELSAGSEVAADGYFADAMIAKTGANALSNTAWECDRDLSESSTYYWHVRAVSATSNSEWATGVFTTVGPEPEPYVPPEEVEEPPTTPMYIWVIIGVGAALVIAVIILIITTRRTTA